MGRTQTPKRRSAAEIPIPRVPIPSGSGSGSKSGVESEGPGAPGWDARGARENPGSGNATVPFSSLDTSGGIDILSKETILLASERT